MISIKNLSLSYGKRKVFENLNYFYGKENGLICLIGPNGIGKTSLMYCIAGFIPNYIKARLEGEIRVFGKEPTKLKQKFFVFQDVEDSFLYPKVGEEVESVSKDREKTVKILRDLGLEGKTEEYITSLSFGEKHKLAIALALLSDSKIVFFDESFSSLDRESKLEAIRDIKELSKKAIVMLTTHDLQLVYEIGEEVVEMKTNCLEIIPKNKLEPFVCKDKKFYEV